MAMNIANLLALAITILLVVMIGKHNNQHFQQQQELLRLLESRKVRRDSKGRFMKKEQP